MIRQGEVEEWLRLWTDSGWAGDGMPKGSCSGGCIQCNGGALCHWSETQWHVAMSSGEAELNSAARGISEGKGDVSVLKERVVEDRSTFQGVDARAYKGLLLRTGAGKAKHLSTKQFLAQGAIKSYGAEM